MPTNKKFAYASGDEGDTDAFISSTITSAPKNVDQMELQTGQFASSRDGSYYAVDNGGRKEFRNNCSRIIVFIFSAILCLVGIGLMVGAGLEKKQGILPICPNCDKIITALFAIGGIVLAFGLLGFFAASSRSGFVSCIFILVLIILTLLFLGTGVGFIVIQGGTHLEDMWTGAVAHDADAVCNVQKNLKCSGFNFCCYNGNTTTTTTTTSTAAPVNDALVLAEDNFVINVGAGDDNASSTTTTTVTSSSATVVTSSSAPTAGGSCAIVTGNADEAKYCVSSCYAYGNPCAPILKDDLKKLTAPVAGVAFPLGVLCALVAWASKRMLAKEGD